MADTTNYGWTKPNVAGSNGTWGTLLNQAMDDIDADLKTVETAAGAAQTSATTALNELIGQALIHANNGYLDNTNSSPATGTYARNQGGFQVGINGSTFPQTGALWIPLRDVVRVGQKITAFTSIGQRPSSFSGTVTVKLGYFSFSGVSNGLAWTQVSAGHSLTASPGGGVDAQNTTSGLNEVVAAGRDYYVLFEWSLSSYQGNVTLSGVKLTVTR